MIRRRPTLRHHKVVGMSTTQRKQFVPFGRKIDQPHRATNGVVDQARHGKPSTGSPSTAVHWREPSARPTFDDGWSARSGRLAPTQEQPVIVDEPSCTEPCSDEQTHCAG